MKTLSFFIALLVFVIGCKAQENDIETTAHGIEWLPNSEAVKAGAILVPENHEEPDGKKIRIAYIVLKARDTTVSNYPMIFFSGGPGGNTLDPGMVNFLLEQHPMREKRDIILFDQRGIGYSSALPDMSFASFNIMAKNADEEEELKLMEDMVAAYQKKCEEQYIEPKYYNTLQNAKDVGMLFKHLGYEKYNLFGGSYGTRLARVVQDMFPSYINSSVLDSPSPLSGDFLIDRLDSYSLALGRIIDYCETTPACQGSYPSLKEDYFKAIEILKKKPLLVSMSDSLDIYINAQDGIYLLRRLLYQNDAREKAPELIKAFIEGGGKVINDVLQFEYQITGGLNLSMLLSVEKYEQFNSANTPEEIQKQYDKYPLIPAKLGFFDAFYQAGMSWHTGNLPIEDRSFQDSAIPTLIFVNQFDPVTPPIYGHLFMKNLSSGTLLILDEGGHGSGNAECKDQVIIDFMDHPNEKPDVSCLHIYGQ